MKIPTKFYLNTENFKIYFDNEKKTYVCEDLETKEKTNIGVLGTFLQMGILKTISENPINYDDRINYLMDKIVSLEEKLNKTIILTSVKKPELTENEEINRPRKMKIQEIEQESGILKKEPILKKYPKSVEEEPTVSQRIVKKMLEKTIENENKEPSKDLNPESEDEIDNWMEI